MTAASPKQMNDFVREVDLFMRNYQTLISPEVKTAAINSGDAQLVSDYNKAVNNGAALKTSIEAVTGAWTQAKAYYQDLTDKSSMYIGDAVDYIRGWFGYNPGGMNGLGALQIPAAAFVVGAIGAAILLNRAMDKLFVSIEASRIQKDQPSISRAQAIAQAQNAIGPKSLFSGIGWPITIASLGALWFLSR